MTNGLTGTTEPPAGLSTEQPPAAAETQVVAPGDVVLVRLDQDIYRPLTVAWIGLMDIRYRGSQAEGIWKTREELRVSGTLHCVPGDRSAQAFRDLWVGVNPQLQLVQDPAQFHTAPDARTPCVLAEHLALAGADWAIGTWRPRRGV